MVRKTQFALDEAKTKERELAHINQIMQMANATFDFDEVFAVILDGLKEIFTFDAIGIQLVNESQSSLNIHKVYGEHITEESILRCQEIEILITKNNCVSSSVFGSGELAYFPRIRPDTRFYKIDKKIYQVLHYTSYLGCPLIVQGKIIGVISFITTGVHIELKEYELAKIQRYVTSISTTINNAKIYQQLKHPNSVFSLSTRN